jgi:biotin carboxyl carrier protein
MTKIHKLLIGMLIFATVDALGTNWLIAHNLATEANPLMKPFAGTVWLPVIKIGWVVFMGSLILLVSRMKKRKEVKSCLNLDR